MPSCGALFLLLRSRLLRVPANNLLFWQSTLSMILSIYNTIDIWIMFFQEAKDYEGGRDKDSLANFVKVQHIVFAFHPNIAITPLRLR